jgi:hypothetical protein
MSFGQNISNWTERVKKRHNQVFRGVALRVFASVVFRTPVDTGRARGNWQTDINKDNNAELSIDDKGGLMVYRNAQQSASRVKLGDQFYLFNNLGYVQGLEDGNSLQAPNGMVKVTVANFKNIVSDVVRATE